MISRSFFSESTKACVRLFVTTATTGRSRRKANSSLTSSTDTSASNYPRITSAPSAAPPSSSPTTSVFTCSDIQARICSWGGRSSGKQDCVIGPSVEPVSFTQDQVSCCEDKIVCSIRTTYSYLGKLSPDEATLPPVSYRAPQFALGFLFPLCQMA